MAASPDRTVLGSVADLADSVADVILIVDTAGRIVAANRAARERLGGDPVGKGLDAVLGAEAYLASREALAAAAEGASEFEAPLMAGCGQPAGFLWVASPREDGTIALAGRDMAYVYGLDLIKHLSADVHEKQRRLEVVGEINRALARSVHRAEIDARVAREITRLLPVDYLQVAVTAGSPELFDLRILRPDGAVVLEESDRPWAGSPFEEALRTRRPRVRPAAALGGAAAALGMQGALDMPVVLDDQALGVLSFLSGRPEGYRAGDHGVVAPVVGQYAVALANARLVRGLEEANRAKRELIQIASHELNTPLTVIKGMSSVLANAGSRGIPPEQLDTLLGSIDQQADRLIKLVNDLLLVSQIEAGRIDLYLTTVDLWQLARDTAASVARGFGERQWAIAASGGIFIRQDANKLIRCLQQLLSNAFKFSPPESAVEVAVKPGADGYEISVFNEDREITDAELAGIFEKFGRLARHQSSHEGVGLGLYTTRRLAQRLGGDVRVATCAGRGPTFTLVVPDLQGRNT
ncbi:MAG: PAS domain-containing protein [Candidatus Sericytochromatia bacterium]|nr:PAS domain-containing protein [Candidatus Tanganyikabacteria bacterium]